MGLPLITTLYVFMTCHKIFKSFKTYHVRLRFLVVVVPLRGSSFTIGCAGFPEVSRYSSLCCRHCDWLCFRRVRGLQLGGSWTVSLEIHEHVKFDSIEDDEMAGVEEEDQIERNGNISAQLKATRWL